MSHQAEAVALLCAEQHLLPAHSALTLLEQASRSATSPVDALVASVGRDAVLAAIAAVAGLELVDLTAPEQRYLLDKGLLARSNIAWLEKLTALPLLGPDGEVVIVAANPLTQGIAELCQAMSGAVAVLGSADQIRDTLLRALTSRDTDAATEAADDAAAAAAPAEGPKVLASGGAVSDWLEATIRSAISQGVSDVHLERDGAGRLLVRFRVDGTLEPQRVPAAIASQGKQVIAAMKHRAGMDASDSVIIQDGRQSMHIAGRAVDLRVNTVPTVNGGEIVIRLLDSANVQRKLDDMGFSPEALALLREAAHSRQGACLVSGGTGTGKTTTLYALMNEIAGPDLKVVTIEEPVEYRRPLMTQIEVTTGLGERSLTFATGLRGTLRQDPDVILVGETRDKETAETVFHAAMTGHMVFSTVHANSALETYGRLIDMGVARWTVADSVTLLLSQRLLRRVHSCAKIRPVTEGEAAYLAELDGSHVATVAEPVGCPACRGTGYRGRIPVLEVLRPTESVRAAVIAGASRAQLREVVTDTSVPYIPLSQDVLRHVAAHTTSLAEMRSVLVT